jgi:hypothetical protein
MSPQISTAAHAARSTPTVPTMERTMTDHTAPRSRKDAARKDSLGFTLIYAATFAIFFVVAVVDRLVPVRWILGAAKSENYMAVFTEAKMAAATYTPFAFMG